MYRLVIALVALLALAASLMSATAAQAASGPVIPDAPVFEAPIGEKGGIMTPPVYCPNWRVSPRVRVVMRSLDSDWVRRYAWRGTLPGYGFPRAAVGDYKIRTLARCRATRKVRVEYVTVEQKTREKTVSRAEFRRVKRGMTRARVAQIVGFDGQSAGRYQGVYRRYDMMDFWAWSLIKYRDGRVVAKYWDVDHD